MAPNVRPMNWLRKSLGIAALSSGAALLSTACEDNESMLFIVGVIAVNLLDDCAPDNTPTQTMQQGGILDTTLNDGRGYRAAILVASQLTSRGSREQLRTETARLALEGAEITITDSRGRPIALQNNPNPFTSPGAGIVDTASGINPAYGVLWVQLVPPKEQITDSILVHVRAFGTTRGGTELESGEFLFPIDVCQGCLIGYPSDAADDTGSVPAGDLGPPGRFLCRSVGEGAGEENVCFLGQDAPVSCTACSGFNAACKDPCKNCSTYSPELCGSIPAPTGCAQ